MNAPLRNFIKYYFKNCTEYNLIEQICNEVSGNLHLSLVSNSPLALKVLSASTEVGGMVSKDHDRSCKAFVFVLHPPLVKIPTSFQLVEAGFRDMLAPLPRAPGHFQLFLVVSLASPGSSHLPGQTRVSCELFKKA